MDDDAKLKATLDQLLAHANNATGAKNALAFLFPKLETILKTYIRSDESSASVRKLQRRISQSDFYPNYFRLNPSKDFLGKGEIELILNNPTSAFQYLAQRIQHASPRDQSRFRALFIEILDSAFSSDRKITEEWVSEIVRTSPDLIKEADRTNLSLFNYDNLDRLRWLLLNAFAQLEVSERSRILRASIASAHDLTLLCIVVRSMTGDTNPDGAKDQSDRAKLGSEGEDIRSQLLERVRNLADGPQFWMQARPDQLLWFWWGSNSGDEIKQFTNSSMRNDHGLRGLLTSTISMVYSTAGNYEQVSESWSEIVDLAALQQRASELLNSDLESDKSIATRFLTALSRGREF